MTDTTYTHIFDLAGAADPPADGILSRTIFQDDKMKAVVFGFGPNQELSEHTAAKPAMLYFVKGEASVGLGDDAQEAQAGTWVHMPANLKHSIKAKTPVVTTSCHSGIACANWG
jgi:quercetin dioxygenase-like cupin family protein